MIKCAADHLRLKLLGNMEIPELLAFFYSARYDYTIDYSGHIPAVTIQINSFYQ